MASNQRLAWNRLWLRRIVLGVVLGLLLLPLMATAQEQTAVVRSDPSVIEIAPGQTITVTVVLADAQDVYGIDVHAAFDPLLVEVVDADPAREGVQFSPGSFPQPDFVARNVADNQAGTLRYAITQVNPTEPATGEGVLFTVQLRANAESGEGAFTIGPVQMADRSGGMLAVQSESGLIKIVPTEPSASAEAAAPDPSEPASPAPADVSTAAASGTTLPILAIVALVAVVAVVVWVIVRRRAGR